MITATTTFGYGPRFTDHGACSMDHRICSMVGPLNMFQVPWNRKFVCKAAPHTEFWAGDDASLITWSLAFWASSKATLTSSASMHGVFFTFSKMSLVWSIMHLNFLPTCKYKFTCARVQGSSRTSKALPIPPTRLKFEASAAAVLEQRQLRWRMSHTASYWIAKHTDGRYACEVWFVIVLMLPLESQLVNGRSWNTKVKLKYTQQE